ncbi:nucleotidyltransferase domain-containing protein [Paratractidigestivibacter sp.]|uniref:nucleotidyltransferase family protein n=1 Tax=Paratractidigestivibacter sp. TaxID=2847316 RepID=UPI002ABE8F8E|nr:nucleotidyltransferase domain-containing protein [Paratractidigestivibacter sp.]
MIIVTPAREEKARVSLRLPNDLADAIERYASEKHLSKTDAYVRFLRLGINAEAARPDTVALREISVKLDAVLARMDDTGTPAGRTDKDGVVASVREVAARYSGIEKVYLFGSFARGTYGKESDVDLRVVLDDAEPFGLRELSHFAKEIEQRTGREADVVSARVIKNEALKAAVERDKELIYERQE